MKNKMLISVISGSLMAGPGTMASVEEVVLMDTPNPVLSFRVLRYDDGSTLWDPTNSPSDLLLTSAAQRHALGMHPSILFAFRQVIGHWPGDNEIITQDDYDKEAYEMEYLKWWDARQAPDYNWLCYAPQFRAWESAQIGFIGE